MAFCGFGGEKWKNHFDEGVYVCAKCKAPLFNSTTKYKHNSPWPAFSDTVTRDCLKKRSDGRDALKVSCANCGLGLGHEFLNDGEKKGESRF